MSFLRSKTTVEGQTVFGADHLIEQRGAVIGRHVAGIMPREHAADPVVFAPHGFQINIKRRVEAGGYAMLLVLHITEAVDFIVIIDIIIPIGAFICGPGVKREAEVDLLLAEAGFQHFLHAKRADADGGINTVKPVSP